MRQANVTCGNLGNSRRSECSSVVSTVFHGGDRRATDVDWGFLASSLKSPGRCTDQWGTQSDEPFIMEACQVGAGGSLVGLNPLAADGFGKFLEKWRFAIDGNYRLPMIRLLVTGTRLPVTLIFDNLVETSCKIRLRIISWSLLRLMVIQAKSLKHKIM